MTRQRWGGNNDTLGINEFSKQSQRIGFCRFIVTKIRNYRFDTATTCKYCIVRMCRWRRRGGSVDSVAYANHRGGGFKREIITRGRARDAGVSHALQYCKRVARTRARVLSSREDCLTWKRTADLREGRQD